MRASRHDPAGEAHTGGHFGGASSLWPAQLPREPASAWGLLRSRGNRAQASRRQGKPHRVRRGSCRSKRRPCWWQRRPGVESLLRGGGRGGDRGSRFTGPVVARRAEAAAATAIAETMPSVSLPPKENALFKRILVSERSPRLSLHTYPPDGVFP